MRTSTTDETIDADVVAALIIGPLANHRRAAWTFGRPPLDIDDERLLRTWHAAVTELVTSARAQPDTRPTGPERALRTPRARRH